MSNINKSKNTVKKIEVAAPVEEKSLSNAEIVEGIVKIAKNCKEQEATNWTAEQLARSFILNKIEKGLQEDLLIELDKREVQITWAII